MSVSFIASVKAPRSGTFHCRVKLRTYIPLGLFSHKDNVDFYVHLLGVKYVFFFFTRISNYSLVSIFSPHPTTPFVSASSACCWSFVSKIQFWPYHSPAQNSTMAPNCFQSKIPTLRLHSKLTIMQTQHSFPASSHIISFHAHYPSSRWFPNLSGLQNHLVGLWKDMFRSLMPSISDSVSLRWGLEILPLGVSNKFPR